MRNCKPYLGGVWNDLEIGFLKRFGKRLGKRRISKNFKEFQRISKSFKEFERIWKILKDFEWFWKILKDYFERFFSKDYFKRFQKILKDFDRFWPHCGGHYLRSSVDDVIVAGEHFHSWDVFLKSVLFKVCCKKTIFENLSNLTILTIFDSKKFLMIVD